MIEQVEKLEDVLEPQAGQTVYSKNDKAFYRWDPIEGWECVFKDTEGALLSMSAYDMNRQIIGQLEIIGEKALQEKKKMVREFVENTKNQFYMLLCKDFNYFTLFQLDTYKNANEKLEDILVDECLWHLGNVKSIDLTEDETAIEIWITAQEETYVMYFFPYDTGVILCV